MLSNKLPTTSKPEPLTVRRLNFSTNWPIQRLGFDSGGNIETGLCRAIRANDRPSKAFVTVAKAATNQIAYHLQKFIQIFTLRCHFGLVAGSNQHIVVLLDLEHELFFHKSHTVSSNRS